MLKYKDDNNQTKFASDSTFPCFELNFVRQRTAKLHKKTALHFRRAFYCPHVKLQLFPTVTFTGQIWNKIPAICFTSVKLDERRNI